MTLLAPSFALAAAVLAGTQDIRPPAPAPVEEEARTPATGHGQGGPYEPAEEAADVVVEGKPAEAPTPFTIVPDPELEDRYAPRQRAPLNRVTIPF